MNKRPKRTIFKKNLVCSKLFYQCVVYPRNIFLSLCSGSSSLYIVFHTHCIKNAEMCRSFLHIILKFSKGKGSLISNLQCKICWGCNCNYIPPRKVTCRFGLSLKNRELPFSLHSPCENIVSKQWTGYDSSSGVEGDFVDFRGNLLSPMLIASAENVITKLSPCMSNLPLC